MIVPTKPITPLVREPFRSGHVRRRQQCAACGNPTRRTVLAPATSGRYAVCSRCELPDAETRLLMAVFNVVTVPALDARIRTSAEPAVASPTEVER